MAHARIVSEWVYNEDLEGHISKIELDFNNINGLSDMVAKAEVPPSPNVYVGFVEDSSNGALTQIANDPAYGAGAILLTHNNEASAPTQAEFDAIRNFLLTKLTKDPPSLAQVDAAIGTAPKDRTRWEISQSLIAYLKNL